MLLENLRMLLVSLNEMLRMIMISATIMFAIVLPQLSNTQLMGSPFTIAQLHELPMARISGTESGFATEMSHVKQNPDIPCGLPPFADKLPPGPQERLRDVWKGYKEGTECGMQQAQTFAIVRSLSDQERANIFGQPPTMQHSLPNDVGNTSQSMFLAHSTVPDWVPMFIRTSSPEIKRKFDAIWMNETIDLNERYNQMEKLANQLLNAQQLADFNSWIGAIRTQKAQLDARIAALSTEAREALNEIKTLRAKERSIMQSLSKQAATELLGLF
ncbi:OV39 antigen [Toxocara canis]|uniref:OV39 antigen n=1 Tax=Toxocara canis TaxID=6265 RepID=A0A0B2VVL9_TOXCA|nr:OV39 antigen [Toxocara canis]